MGLLDIQTTMGSSGWALGRQGHTSQLGSEERPCRCGMWGCLPPSVLMWLSSQPRSISRMFIHSTINTMLAPVYLNSPFLPHHTLFLLLLL